MPRRPMATIAQCAEALEKTGGFLTKAAETLNITAGALSRKIKKSKTLQEILKNVLENRLDFAESELLKNMKQNDVLSVKQKAIEFFLRYKGKDRDYIESQRHIHEGGEKPVSLKVVIEKAKPEDLDGSD